MLFQILVPVLIIQGLTICFCTMLLTCVRTMPLCWVGGVMGEYIRRPSRDVDTVLDTMKYDESCGLSPSMAQYWVSDWIPPYHNKVDVDAELFCFPLCIASFSLCYSDMLTTNISLCLFLQYYYVWINLTSIS